MYSKYWDINRWHDCRLLQVQAHLLPRVSSILASVALRPKPQGPRLATRNELLQNLQTTHPWHNWRPGCRQASCVNCGIRLAAGCKLERIRTLAGQPCPKSSVDLVSLAVHVTHKFVSLGVMKGWRCRCGLTLKMHARETAWLRSARGCRAY